MKTISKLALAAALAGISSTAFVAPAFAKDKKAADAKPGLKLSPDVLKAAQLAQPAIAANDLATAETNVALIEANAKTDDDKYIGAALRYDLEQRKLAAAQTANPNAPINETALARPLDVLLSNPSTPPEMRSKYAFRRGALAFNGKQYAQAITYFQQAKQAGYTDNDIDLLIVKSKVESGDVAGGLADLDASMAKTIAAGQKPPEDYYRYAIARSNAAKNAPQTLEWLKKYVAAYPSAKTWRDVIVTYGLAENSIVKLDASQKIDLYRLLRADHALADQADYGDYAQKTLDKGLPAETIAVLKEGAATGKLPASNSYASTLMSTATQQQRNEGSLATVEKRAAASADGKVAAQTGDAYLGADNNAKAIELYRLALQKGGVNADEVNTRLGIALARSGDKAAAKEAFAKVTGQPRAGVANLWVSWLDAPGA